MPTLFSRQKSSIEEAARGLYPGRQRVHLLHLCLGIRETGTRWHRGFIRREIESCPGSCSSSFLPKHTSFARGQSISHATMSLAHIKLYWACRHYGLRFEFLRASHQSQSATRQILSMLFCRSQHPSVQHIAITFNILRSSCIFRLFLSLGDLGGPSSSLRLVLPEDRQTAKSLVTASYGMIFR